MQVKQQTLVVTIGDTDYLSKSGLAHRYNVTVQTVDRWKKNPKLNFPPPDLIINSREYRKVATIETWERKRATTPSE
jgi:DNA-binding transcriptional regulator YiaG